MSSTITGSNPNGVTLTDPSESPVTVTSAGSISSLPGGFALYGSPAVAWNLTNFGHITASGTVSTGVLLEKGGTVTNGEAGGGGYIAGGRQGISIAQAAGTVTNFGSVAGYAAGGTGIFLHAGGTLDNFGAITGYQNGADITGSTGTITNYGTIRATGTILTYGVVLNATAGNFLTNKPSGYIGATAGIGVFGTAGPATILNSGTIVNGLDLGAGGSIANGQAGSISGDIVIRGAPGTVVNYGAMTNGFDVGVELNHGGMVSNAQAGAVIAPSNYAADGVVIYGGFGTVGNLGTISVAGTDGGDAVFLGNGGTVVEWLFGGIDGPAEGRPVRSRIPGSRSGKLAGTVTNFGSIIGGYGVFSARRRQSRQCRDRRLYQRPVFRRRHPDHGGQFRRHQSRHAQSGRVEQQSRLWQRRRRLIGNGRITNGGRTDTTALIMADESGVTAGSIGTISIGAEIDGTGTIANFGTISGTRTGALLGGGGRLTNGASGAGEALLSGAYAGSVARRIRDGRHRMSPISASITATRDRRNRHYARNVRQAIP